MPLTHALAHTWSLQGYMKEGHFVNDDYKALKHYVHDWFVLDVIGAFPLNFILDLVNTCGGESEQLLTCGTYRSNRIVRMLRMFKLTKLTRMLKLTRYLECAQPFAQFACMLHGRSSVAHTPVAHGLFSSRFCKQVRRGGDEVQPSCPAGDETLPVDGHLLPLVWLYLVARLRLCACMPARPSTSRRTALPRSRALRRRVRRCILFAQTR